MKEQRVTFPEKLKPLWKPKRYKIIYGGRGSAKSWSVARALLLKGASEATRVLCAREIQKSIRDSVHQLLADQIKELNLENFYEIQNTAIRGRNGSAFWFEGLKYNTASLKSYEGVNICWVEEAQLISRHSWDVLIPTIRKEGSEIWITFNPELEEDETYQRFIVSPPSNAVKVKINWRDNPWFPETLKQEKDDMKARDEQKYRHIWEGELMPAVEGAIFADEIQQAEEEGRITKVKYDESRPVDTFWDLGRSDLTAIWFIQKVGLEHHVLQHYSNSHKKMQHYLKYLQDQPYRYGIHYLPHDAKAEQLGQEKTIEQQVKDTRQKVVVVPRPSNKDADGIEPCRNIFPHVWFDKDGCAEGLSSLRRYRYEEDEETGKISKNPRHDIYSHSADAFQTFALARTASLGDFNVEAFPKQKIFDEYGIPEV